MHRSNNLGLQGILGWDRMMLGTRESWRIGKSSWCLLRIEKRIGSQLPVPAQMRLGGRKRVRKCLSPCYFAKQTNDTSNIFCPHLPSLSLATNALNRLVSNVDALAGTKSRPQASNAENVMTMADECLLLVQIGGFDFYDDKAALSFSGSVVSGKTALIFHSLHPNPNRSHSPWGF